MGSYRLTPRARQDLRQIWHYVAEDSENAADALLARLLDKLTLAADNALIGVARPELGAGARMLVEGAYLILYRPESYGILAVAVVHGMTDPQSWLDD